MVVRACDDLLLGGDDAEQFKRGLRPVLCLPDGVGLRGDGEPGCGHDVFVRHGCSGVAARHRFLGAAAAEGTQEG